MEPNIALQRLRSAGSSAEILMVRAFNVDFSWEKGTQHGMTYYEEGFGVRVIKGHRQGFAYGPQLDDELLSRAMKAADASKEDPYNSIPSPEGRVEEIPDSYDAALEEPHDAIRGLLDALVSLSSGAYNLIMARAWGGWAEVRILNTEGVDVSSRNSFTGVAAVGNYVKGDYVGPEVSEYLDSRRLNGLRPELVVERLSLKTEMTAARRRADITGRPILLTPKAVNALLFPLLNHSINLENIVRGRSPLRPGEAVGVKVTITDDPRLPDGPWSRSFDGEGLPTMRTTVIKDGVFLTPLSNTYWARRASAANTHSSWRTFMSLPVISATYLVIEGPSVKDVGDAVIVDDVQGVHTSNFDAGEFSVTASVAWDDDGGIREFVVSGDLKSLLSGLEGAAHEGQRYGRVVTGSLLVRGLRTSS